MSNIADQRIVATHTIRGIDFEVERTSWTNSDGLSFDVRQVETGFALHNESFDNQPTVQEIEQLIDQLAEAWREDALDSTFFDEREVLEFLFSLQPKVQILHGRDPDSECDIQVYLNGRLVHDVEVEDIDPGRGYDRSTWNERITEAAVAADAEPDSEFRQHVVGWLKEASDSQYITGDEPEEETWTFCGHWTDADDIAIDYVLPGEQVDIRMDTGAHEGGLWAASASGPSVAIAQARAIAEYVDADHEHAAADDPQAEVLSHLRHTHQYRDWVDVSAADAVAVHNALHGA